MFIKKVLLPWFCALCAITLFSLMVSAGNAAAATQQDNLHRAIQDFEALNKDQQRGMWRESWEKLESRFAAIQKQGPDFAPEALFYRGRSLEELGDRSKNRADYQSAVKLYGTFAETYSKHPLADNALYNQAMILSGPLKDKKTALQILDRLILLYPQEDMHSAALTLRERLEGTTAPTSRPAPQTTTSGTSAASGRPASTGANTQEQQRLYNAAAAQWRTLISDNQKAGLRDSWLALEKNFQAALNAAPQGADAHKAAYQAARCREELAKRSVRKDDWSAAANAFAGMARQYPASSLADDAMYAQAEILSSRLGQKSEARAVLERLLAAYPKGDMQPKAQKLLKELPAAASSTSATTSVRKPSASSQKVTGNTGNKNTKAPASGALLRYMEWSGDADSITLIIELAGKAKYRRNILAPSTSPKAPLRARIDLLNTNLGSNVRQSVTLTGVPLGSINISRPDSKTTRVDLDLSNARSYKVTVLQNPYRLKVEISAGKVLPGAEDLHKIARPKQPPAINGNLSEQLGMSMKTVVIDAGHGGKDPGAVGNGMHEADITLKLAKKIGVQLKKNGFNVVYTREANQYIALEDRTSMANSCKADLFISVHVNSSKNKNLCGLETYYLDVARSDAAALVAARENSVDINATSDLQFILSDLTRETKKAESLDVSNIVHQATLKKLKNKSFKTTDNGVRSAPFHVLLGARMPAFLIEVGYISHASDAARLKNPKYMDALAEGVCDGIIAYRKKINSMSAR